MAKPWVEERAGDGEPAHCEYRQPGSDQEAKNPRPKAEPLK
jgi:hypothetical protein